MRATLAAIMVGMAHAHSHGQEPAALGPLLQYWRRARNLSQLALAHEANVSPRHVCFLETGRAKPSRDMVLLLADTLAVPLRERNALLLAAGFAPMFRMSTLDDRELAPVRTAIDAILKQQEPYPAVVMNRHWDVLATNTAATRFFGMLLDGRPPQGAGNILRLMFHPEGLRPFVENWEAVAQALVRRVHREAVGGRLDEEGRALLAEVLNYPGVPQQWRMPDLVHRSSPSCQSFQAWRTAVSLLLGGHGARHSTGHTLQELRVECFFPLDDATAAACSPHVRYDSGGARDVICSTSHRLRLCSSTDSATG